VAGVLERWNNAYTDFSSLLPFMKKDPDAYKSFIAEFPDRVLFGTDATMGWADLTRAYLGFVREMLRDEEVLQKILSLNYLRVHGLRDESGE
jgi:predicted TIM-barrel fold metal-dependent hydrolase